MSVTRPAGRRTPRVRSIEPALGAARGLRGGAPERRRRRRRVRGRGGRRRRRAQHAFRGRRRAPRWRSTGAASGYRLAWRVLAPVSSTGVYDVMVDARTGAVVRRANRVKFAATRRSSATTRPTRRGPVDAVDLDAVARRRSDGAQRAERHAFVRRARPSCPYATSRRRRQRRRAGRRTADVHPTTDDHDLRSGRMPDARRGLHAARRARAHGTRPRRTPVGANRDQSATQLFYLVNTFHDHLQRPDQLADRRFGERPAAGDPNSADPATATRARPGAGRRRHGPNARGPDARRTRNNASFLTLPDGQPGAHARMPHLLRRRRQPFGGYDGANDAVAGLPRVHARDVRTGSSPTRPGFGALNTRAGGRDRRGDERLLRAGLPRRRRACSPTTPAPPTCASARTSTTRGPVRYQPIDCAPLVGHARAPRRRTGVRRLHLRRLRPDRGLERARGARGRGDLGADAVVAARRR